MQILAGDMTRREYRRRRTGQGGSHVDTVSDPESSTAQLTSFILDALSLPSPVALSLCSEESDDKMAHMQGAISGVISSQTSSQSSRRESCAWTDEDDVNSDDACEETSNGVNKRASDRPKRC